MPELAKDEEALSWSNLSDADIMRTQAAMIRDQGIEIAQLKQKLGTYEKRPKELPKTFSEAETEVLNEVYTATQLLERLADAHLIRGNGHHIRQAAARLVADLLKERWIDL